MNNNTYLNSKYEEDRYAHNHSPVCVCVCVFVYRCGAHSGTTESGATNAAAPSSATPIVLGTQV